MLDAGNASPPPNAATYSASTHIQLGLLSHPRSFANASIRLPIRNSCQPLRRSTLSVCLVGHGRNHGFGARPSPRPKHPRPVVSLPELSRRPSYPSRLARRRAAADPFPKFLLRRQNSQCDQESAASLLAIPRRAVVLPNRFV